MSTFDQRVCEWLNTASIPNEKKQLLLNRMSVGISNYRTLEIDPQRNPPSQMDVQAKVTAAKKPAPKRTSAGPTPRTPKTTGRSTSHVSSQAAPSQQTDGARSPSRTTNANSTIMPYAPPPTTVDVDYTLQQRIAKALRRLQEGDEGTSESPLFLVRPRIPRQQQQVASPTSATASASGTSFSGAVNTGRSTTGASGGLTDRDPQPLTGFGRAETGGTNNTDVPFTSDEALAPHSNENVGRVMPGFVFGSPPDPNFVSDEHDDDVDQPTQDQIMTENEDIRRRNTMKRKSRNAISAETIDPAKAAKFTAAVVPKTEQMRKTIMRGLETHHLFSFLDDDDLEFLANVMRIQTFNKGENVVSKMDPCDEFHVLVEGTATVTDTTTADEYEENMLYGHIDDSNGASPLGTAAGGKRPSNALSASAMLEASGRTTGNLSPGATFGDLALMYESTSPETIQASSEPAVFCTLDRTTYKNICTKASLAKRAQYEDFLSRISWLQGLTREERLRLADALKAAKYNKGDKIIRYGEEGVWFNIIVEGSVDVIGRDKNNNNCYVCSFQAGDCVGELEFLFNHKTVADCVAATDVVRTAKMTAKHFEKVIGPAKEILQRQAGESDVYAYYRQSQKK